MAILYGQEISLETPLSGDFYSFFRETSAEAWFICQVIFMSHSDLGIKYVLLSQTGFLAEYFLMRFNEDIE